jgi:P4 family phage/plasmid primase-like protien
MPQDKEEDKGFKDSAGEDESYDGGRSRFFIHNGKEKSRRVDWAAVRKDIMEEFTFKTFNDTEEIYYYDNGVYHSGGKRRINVGIEERVGDYSGEGKKREVCGHIRDLTGIERSEANSHKNLISINNGLFDLEKWKLSPFDPDIVFTYKIPINFGPTAECSKFMAFMEDILKDKEDEIEFLQEWTGYFLYPEYKIPKSLWITGPTHTGKTTLTNIWVALLGDENILKEEIASLEHKEFAVANLYGKLANFSAEVRNAKLLSSTIFKKLTGQDPISAHIKYVQRTLDFTNHAKLVVYGNKLPDLSAVMDDDATWERIHPLELVNQHLVDPNRDLLDEILTREELSGILNWALRGLKRLIENKWEFTKTINEEEARFILMLRSNHVLAFFHDRCERERGTTVSTDAVFSNYEDFCEMYGEDYEFEPLGKDEFDKKLKKVTKLEIRKLGPRGNRQKFWVGMKLHKEQENENNVNLIGVPRIPPSSIFRENEEKSEYGNIESYNKDAGHVGHEANSIIDGKNGGEDYAASEHDSIETIESLKMRISRLKSKYGSKESLKMQIYEYINYTLESEFSGFDKTIPFSAISTHFRDIPNGDLKAVLWEMKDDGKLRIVKKTGAWDEIRDSTMFELRP